MLSNVMQVGCLERKSAVIALDVVESRKRLSPLVCVSALCKCLEMYFRQDNKKIMAPIENADATHLPLASVGHAAARATKAMCSASLWIHVCMYR